MTFVLLVLALALAFAQAQAQETNASAPNATTTGTTSARLPSCTFEQSQEVTAATVRMSNCLQGKSAAADRCLCFTAAIAAWGAVACEPPGSSYVIVAAKTECLTVCPAGCAGYTLQRVGTPAPAQSQTTMASAQMSTQPGVTLTDDSATAAAGTTTMTVSLSLAIGVASFLKIRIMNLNLIHLVSSRTSSDFACASASATDNKEDSASIVSSLRSMERGSANAIAADARKMSPTK